MELDPIFVTYGSLIAMALVPIYLGCHLSLETEKDAKQEDRLTGSDAYMFPIIGSIFLFSFYIVFKFFPKEYINYLLTAYFAIFGTVSLSQLAVRLAQTVVRKDLELAGHYTVTVKHRGAVVLEANITWLNVLMSVLSAAFSAYYVWSKHWIASNIFGECFSITAISMIHLDSFATGMILLCGLFIYDIFWVFGTDVMVTVAKSFDVPIKLLFPRNVFELATTAKPNFSMLGLGDIVLPGCFLALCLKFDAHLGMGTNWYFAVGLFFYLLGLGTTMGVMHVFKAAQPALLYLSPACILSVLICAFFRGQLEQLFAFESGKEEVKGVKTRSRGSPRKTKGE